MKHESILLTDESHSNNKSFFLQDEKENALYAKMDFNKIRKKISRIIKPKITEDDVIEEVKKMCDKAKTELNIELTKYTKHATKLAKVTIDKYDLIVLLFSFTTGKLNKFLRKEYYQIKEADIYSHHNMQIQVDGEVLGIAPLSVKIIPKALNVIAASQNVI